MKHFKTTIPLLAATVACMSFSATSLAAEATVPQPAAASASQTKAAPEKKQLSMAEAAKKSANPVSDIWMLITQNDYTALDTEDGHHEMKNRLSFQPVMPVPIFGGDYNLVNRVVVQQFSSPGSHGIQTPNGYTPDDMSNAAEDTFFNDRTNGMGDTVFMSLLAPNRDDGLIWGVGPTVIAPTAATDTLGQDKWQVGPAALVARLGKSNGGSVTELENWNLGILAQQWWSVGGDSDRHHTSQSDIQYFINYKVSPTGMIGMTPDITIDWTKDGKDRFNVPIGLGYIGMFKVGPMPVRWGAEVQYYVMHADPDKTENYADRDFVPYAPDWNFKVFIAPIIANPFK